MVLSLDAEGVSANGEEEMKEAFEQKLTLLIIKLSLLILLFMSTILFLTGYTLNHSVAFFLVGW